MKIYTAGYLGWTPDALDAKVAELDALVVDVRLMPLSRNPYWREAALRARLGWNYVWFREFGNLAYKTGGPVVLADFEAGVTELQRRLNTEEPHASIMLLCACKDVTVCHRKIVADRLAIAWDLDQCGIVHLAPAAKEAPLA